MAVQGQMHNLSPQGAYGLAGRKSLQKQRSFTKQVGAEREEKVQGRAPTRRWWPLRGATRKPSLEKVSRRRAGSVPGRGTRGEAGRGRGRRHGLPGPVQNESRGPSFEKGEFQDGDSRALNRVGDPCDRTGHVRCRPAGAQRGERCQLRLKTHDEV